MGKASKRRAAGARHTGSAGSAGSASAAAPAPFVRRPFEGLRGEPEWVALRDILPAATASVKAADAASLPDDAPREVTWATVLPMAWPALHRTDGTVLVSTQASATSGDTSRDLAASWLQAAGQPAGTPVLHVPMADAATPRLQDLLDPDAELRVELHEDFGFWVGDADLEEEAKASLENANSSIVPTRRVEGAPSVFWVDFGQRRTFVRWVLPQDEDAATDGLARLAAADRVKLTDDSRLLGAFRASGLVVPVWEVDPDADAESFTAAVEAMAGPLEDAIGSTAPLTVDERRARNGLLSRQVTLR